MIVDINKETNTLLLTIQGKVDAHTVGVIKKILNEYKWKYTSIELNMEKLDYISDEGIRLLCDINSDTAQKINFTIVNLPDDIKNVLEQSGFSKKQLV